MRKQELHPRTAIINQKQKQHSKQAKLAALRWLAATFPNAFDTKELVRPLKYNIMEDIMAHADSAIAIGISKSKLREAVVLFTRRIDYLAALKAGGTRIDLEGNPVAPVTEEEIEKAAIRIKKRIEKNVKNIRKQEIVSGPPPHQYPKKHMVDITPSAKASAVIVKHKTARTFDQDAISRLKEKLGLTIKKPASADAE